MSKYGLAFLCSSLNRWEGMRSKVCKIVVYREQYQQTCHFASMATKRHLSGET